MTRRKLDQRRLVSAALRKPPVGQELAAARLWAAERFPYLAHALFAMRVAPIYSLGTVAIDRYWNLRLDPALITNWEPAQLGSMLIHHVSHLLRDHAARAESLRINPAEARRWRIAADAEIEDDLIDAGLQPPYQPILPATLNCETHQLAEQYFRAPWPTPDNPDGDAAESAMRRVSGRGTAGGCGSGSDGIPRAWDSTAWITSD